MLDDILEIILEIILDGIFEAAGSKKVPVPVRVGLSAVLAFAVLGIFSLLLAAGIHSGSFVVIATAVAFLAGAVVWLIIKVGKFQKDQKM